MLVKPLVVVVDIGLLSSIRKELKNKEHEKKTYEIIGSIRCLSLSLSLSLSSLVLLGVVIDTNRSMKVNTRERKRRRKKDEIINSSSFTRIRFQIKGKR